MEVTGIVDAEAGVTEGRDSKRTKPPPKPLFFALVLLSSIGTLAQTTVQRRPRPRIVLA
jgi:hypothetical protein